MLDFNPLSDIWFGLYFSQVIGYLSALLMVSLAMKLFSLMKSHLFIRGRFITSVIARQKARHFVLLRCGREVLLRS